MADEGAPARSLDALRRAEAAVADLVADAHRLGGTRQALEDAAAALAELVQVERALAERLEAPAADPRVEQVAATLAQVGEAVAGLGERLEALTARVEAEGAQQRSVVERALARPAAPEEPVRIAAADVDAIAARVVVEGGRAIDASIAVTDAQDAIEARLEAVRVEVTSAQDRLRSLVLAEGVAVLLLAALLVALAAR